MGEALSTMIGTGAAAAGAGAPDASEVVATTERVAAFLGPLAAARTPVVSLGPRSGLGLECSVFVKDESRRLGQKSFKVLGGTYAAARTVASRQSLEADSLEAVKAAVTEVTLCTASDGNHGAGLAWAAKELGLPAAVWLPKGAVADRVETVRSLGADVRVTDLSYDDTVKLAAKTAEEKGWLLVQDTAWRGYDAVPRLIMDAYRIIAREALEAMPRSAAPTHVFVQVGVGSFAAAIVEYVVAALGRGAATLVAVEPAGSACLYASLRAGKTVEVADSPPTVCQGLDCGTVSTLAWPVLSRELAYACTATDAVAADGVRALRAAGVVSGESGAAVGVGVLRALGADGRAEKLGITAESRVLIFNTEGVTAPGVTEEILAAAPAATTPADVSVLKVSH